jgi:hypothetical protein
MNPPGIIQARMKAPIALRIVLSLFDIDFLIAEPAKGSEATPKNQNPSGDFQLGEGSREDFMYHIGNIVTSYLSVK